VQQQQQAQSLNQFQAANTLCAYFNHMQSSHLQQHHEYMQRLQQVRAQHSQLYGGSGNPVSQAAAGSALFPTTAAAAATKPYLRAAVPMPSLPAMQQQMQFQQQHYAPPMSTAYAPPPADSAAAAAPYAIQVRNLVTQLAVEQTRLDERCSKKSAQLSAALQRIDQQLSDLTSSSSSSSDATTDATAVADEQSLGPEQLKKLQHLLRQKKRMQTELDAVRSHLQELNSQLIQSHQHRMNTLTTLHSCPQQYV
jgi:hypothetical protein